MTSLTKQIESIIEKTVLDYITKITGEYKEIKQKDLLKIWNSISESKNKGQNKINNTDSGCIYKFTKMAKKGQFCGDQVKFGTMCTKHKKYEGKSPKEIKVTPFVKQPKSRSPTKHVEIVLRHNNDIGKLWHQQSKLVFRSAKSRIVTGKYNGNKIKKLTKEDVEECKRFGFVYDEKEVEKDNSKTFSIYMEADSSAGGKFWECKIVGNKYSTRYGKIEKPGTTKEKILGSFEEAMALYKKTKKSKLSKGYEEVEIEYEEEEESKKNDTGNENKDDLSSVNSGDDFEEVLDKITENPIDDKDNVNKFIKNALGISEECENTVGEEGVFEYDEYDEYIEDEE